VDDPLLTQVVTRGQLVERRPFHRPSTVSALGSIALDRTFDRIGRVATSRRPAIVEPDFGQINVAQGGHQLRVCGQVKADFEWTFHLARHNFRKLAGSGWTTTWLAAS